jgi:hypothetical protein
MTRPRPTPRPRPKSAVPQKSEDKAKPKQVTWLGKTFVEATDPIGFAAALACKTGEGMLSGSES